MDYINRGPDPRILGKPGAWLQTKLSWHSTKPPKRLFIVGKKTSSHFAITWPLFISIFIGYKQGRWASFRVGWRWDHNWPGYIADVIVKLRINNVVAPY